MSDQADRRWAGQFPRLFAPAYVDYADADIQLTTAPVPSAQSAAATRHVSDCGGG